MPFLKRHYSFSLALLFGALVFNSPLAGSPDPVRAAVLQVSTTDETLQIKTVCAGSVPAGWILINDSWNPMKCGNPSSISYNVWTIERFERKPVGAMMMVCNGPVPAGWMIMTSSWNPASCGHPTSLENNVLTIKRVK